MIQIFANFDEAGKLYKSWRIKLKVRKSHEQTFFLAQIKANEIFGRISAPASKIGQIKEINTHYYTN